MTEDLNRGFQEVFQQLSISEKSVAPDIMLKLYAYYKQALLGNLSAANGESDVKNAFKFNAWTQLNGMSKEQAKQEYINLAKQILTSK